MITTEVDRSCDHGRLLDSAVVSDVGVGVCLVVCSALPLCLPVVCLVLIPFAGFGSSASSISCIRCKYNFE